MVEAEEYLVPIMPNRGWANLDSNSKSLYKERYFTKDEDYELWLDRVCRKYTDNREHRGRMKQYIRNYWFHPATPVSANAGLSDKGFPVSCFVQSAGDSKNGIFSAWESAFYAGSHGAGIGTYWGRVREAGAKVGVTGKSSGIVPFLKVSESMTMAVSQGGLRRASEAVYLPINHPEIEEFISIKDPSGDPARRTPQLFVGVTITEKFLRAVDNDEMFDLISPKTKKVVKQVKARDLFGKILEQRMVKGVPYLLYIDNVNNNLPAEYKFKNMKVETSNLCTEITLHTAPDYSNVCVLSSINLEYYDEYNTPELFETFVKDCHRFLDNVLQDFVDLAKNKKGFKNLVKGAEYERSIGLGFMGLHYYLQKNNIPFDSFTHKTTTNVIFSKFKKVLDKSNEELAKEKGKAPLSAEANTNKRNIHITAIAPTASIGKLCNNTSAGIEPLIANVFVTKTNVGTDLLKNRYLEKVLEKYNKNDEDTWLSILANNGSVKHLEFLTDEEKEVFKTAFEINQQAIIDIAGNRQDYIDQAQSINLFIKPNADMEYLYDLHILAYKVGLKSLYYIRSEAPKKVGTLQLGKSAKDLMESVVEEQDNNKIEECLWCQ